MFPYKNPITPIQIIGSQSVSSSKSFGTNFSVLSTGGYMEVFSLSQLYYTIPPSTYGQINFTGNTIPINFSKGSGTTFSVDTLILNSDNISSGRRKLGMLVYVKEEDQIYQYDINNYENLWNSATGATGIGGDTVIISTFGTTVRANSPEGIAFISGWTANTIDGVSGTSRNDAVWKKYYGSNLSITGGTYSSGTLTLDNVTGGTTNITGFGGINFENEVTVGLPGSFDVDFNSIKDAVDSITGASSTNMYVVRVGPGVFYENPINMKSYIAIIGESSVSTVINANVSNQPLINAVDNTFISDVLIQGCTGVGTSAIMYSSSTLNPSNAIVYVENVRFGANYTHVTNFPFGGGNTAIQCTNIKYGAQPFTLGFYMTSDGSSTGRFQLRNVTTTAGGVANTSGLTFAKVDQPNCTIIGNLVTVTKAGSAPVSGIGFHVENGGLLRLNGFNIQRFGTGIYVPQVGSAPTIDAVGLNFENCTTDVNIIHSGTTGKVNGTDSFLKTKININAPLYEVNKDPRQIVVAKKGGDFNSIKSAIDYLTVSGNTSSTSRYVVSVGPGEFYEDEIDLTNTPYVSIVGSNIQTTQVLPNSNSQHIFRIGATNEISFMSFSGAPVGYAAIYCYDISNFSQLHKISMYDCDTGIWVESVTQDTILYGEYVDMNGQFTNGVKTVGNNGYLALANMENYYSFPTGIGTQYSNFATGSGATINISSSTLEGNGFSGTTAFLSQDGGFYNVASTDVVNYGYGLRVLNVGSSSSFEMNAVTMTDNIFDISVEQITASGLFQGIADHTKTITVSENVFWSFLDSDDGELDITRKASVTFTDGSHTDFTTLIFEGSTMGLLSGGSLTTISGFTVQADGGFGYLEKSDNSGIVRRIDWLNNLITLSANTDNYIYINENSNLVSSGSKPITSYNILLGRVVTNSIGVEFIDLSPLNAEHTSNRFDSLFTEALGPIYSQGSIVNEGTTPYTLDVTQGDYHYSTNEFLPNGGTPITFTQYYRNGTGSTWVTNVTTTVNNTQYDNNGTLTGLTTGYFTKHTLYTLGDGVYEKYFLVLGQNEYSSLVQTENALLPTPPTYFSDGVVQIANIYIQEGSPNIIQIEDIRPTIAFRAGGVNASSVHGNLLGLSADDHIQYLLVSGSRAMSGNFDVGGNDITNVGLVDGVTVSSHAARHQFGGLDPVGSVTPSSNAIPYADVSGKLDNWVSTGSTTTLGKVLLSSSPVSPSSPIVVSENDLRFKNSFTGGTYSTGTLSLTNVIGGIYNITGFYTGDPTPYLPLSGGTVSGNTVFLLGLTANTFSGTSIIVDTVNSTNNTLTESNGDLRVAWSDGHLFNAGNIKVDWNFGYLNNSTGLLSVDWENMVLYDTVSTILSIDWKSRQLFDTSGSVKLDWETGNINNFTQIESTTISATTYQNLPILKTKSGTVAGGSFTGAPRKATVTFTTPYPTTNYSIGITGVNNRTYTYESKTVSGFVINTNANTVVTGNVDWQTIEYGES